MVMGNDWRGQPFDHVANLQIILAIAIGRQPQGCYVVNAVKRHERIVIRLGDFVAEAVNIEYGRVKEKTGPSGILVGET
jgi:hypothetical protein